MREHDWALDGRIREKRAALSRRRGMKDFIID
jgi:hypothetical protein